MRRLQQKPAEWWKNKKFGNLTMIDPEDLHIASGKKKKFKCKCGNVKLMRVCMVTYGNAKTCKECNLKSAYWWAEQKFGRLRMKNPKLMNTWSKQIEEFNCDCGGSTNVKVCLVTSHNTTSCGKCFSVAYNWYLNNKNALKSLKCPIKPEDFPPDGPIPLEVIVNCKTPFRALCPVCGFEYTPRYERVKCGLSITCGCTSNIVSAKNREIAEFVQSLDLKPSLNFDWMIYYLTYTFQR